MASRAPRRPAPPGHTHSVQGAAIPQGGAPDAQPLKGQVRLPSLPAVRWGWRGGRLPTSPQVPELRDLTLTQTPSSCPHAQPRGTRQHPGQTGSRWEPLASTTTQTPRQSAGSRPALRPQGHAWAAAELGVLGQREIQASSRKVEEAWKVGGGPDHQGAPPSWPTPEPGACAGPGMGEGHQGARLPHNPEGGWTTEGRGRRRTQVGRSPGGSSQGRVCGPVGRAPVS